MIVERAAAYVLAFACILQALHPSGTIKPHGVRNIDLQIGRLRVQARNGAGSISFAERATAQNSSASSHAMPLIHSWGKESERLRICINDSGCLTAWLDRTSHAWSISRDRI
jgi:hypothetical protein